MIGIRKISDIQTDGYFLRRIKSSDVENIYHGLSHPDVIKFYGISFTTLEAAFSQMAWYRYQEEKGLGWWWTIRGKEKEAFLGAIGFYDHDPGDHSIQIGFWLLPENWKKGIVTETIPPAIAKAKSHWKLSRVDAEIERRNVGSRKAVEKHGFILQRSFQEEKDGEMIDVDIYSLEL